MNSLDASGATSAQEAPRIPVAPGAVPAATNSAHVLARELPARILEFTVESAEIGGGEPVMPIWATENPVCVTIEPGLGRVTPRGSRQLFPASTTTYTLIVDTIGFNEETEIEGYRHTDALHVVERFSRPEYGYLQYEATLEDPNVFERPFTRARDFAFRPDLVRVAEFICENNRDYSSLFGEQ